MVGFVLSSRLAMACYADTKALLLVHKHIPVTYLDKNFNARKLVYNVVFVKSIQVVDYGFQNHSSID